MASQLHFHERIIKDGPWLLGRSHSVGLVEADPEDLLDRWHLRPMLLWPEPEQFLDLVLDRTNLVVMRALARGKARPARRRGDKYRQGAEVIPWSCLGRNSCGCVRSEISLRHSPNFDASRGGLLFQPFQVAIDFRRLPLRISENSDGGRGDLAKNHHQQQRRGLDTSR
jgi:hypothetical protein